MSQTLEAKTATARERIPATARTALSIEHTPSAYLRIENLIHDLNLTDDYPEDTLRRDAAIKTVTNSKAKGVVGYLQALHEIGSSYSEKEVKALHLGLIKGSIQHLRHSTSIQENRNAIRGLAYAFVLPMQKEFAFLNPTGTGKSDMSSAFVSALADYDDAQQIMALEGLFSGLLQQRMSHEQVESHVAHVYAGVLMKNHHFDPLEKPIQSKLLRHVLNNDNNPNLKNQTIALYLQDLIKQEGYSDFTIQTTLFAGVSYLRLSTPEAYTMLFALKDIFFDSDNVGAYDSFKELLREKTQKERINTMMAIKKLARGRKKSEVELAAKNLDMVPKSNQNVFYEQQYIELMQILANKSTHLFKHERLAAFFVPFLSDDHAPAVQQQARKYINDAIRHEQKGNKARLIEAVFEADTLPIEDLFAFAAIGLGYKDGATHEVTKNALHGALMRMAQDGAFALDSSHRFQSLITRRLKELHTKHLIEGYELSALLHSMERKDGKVKDVKHLQLGPKSHVLFVREE